ncbi:class I SAM-dependent rRNA methyltransferase [Alicyclobacillus sp. ALC3]|uniref:class I SAM-dependent rRNA methyltransferase n=1 Tax=Alicyclobacillus sp. ALC3 TaxID=2796143 RepID=UPI002377DCF6|nr:class I SAM-dependent rRNA methyltransferase [Alicyclobacillus sp. ALC3]WDL99406.1 class I SAM-dependent rRNA methyltransferase [Alicyclobacillus sp. ALC3]
MTTQLKLKRQRKKRLEQGHPWVYASEIDTVSGGEPAPGDVVEIVNHQGAFLAKGYANPKSQIYARVLTYRADESIDTAWAVRRLQAALAYRERLLPDTRFCRLVYGEADFLPGLIIDRYGDVLVAQILSYGMERLKPVLRSAIEEVFRPLGVYLRNDVSVRRLEGLEEHTGLWWGEVPRLAQIEEHGLTFLADLYEGQKTGYFYDQRDNRAAIAPFVPNAEVLDCFCHTGGFAVHAAHYGAKRVTGVDISGSALEVARRNAEMNGLADKIDFQEANAFDFLRDADRDGRLFDVVMLDPPAFAKSKRALEGAIRGYKEINLRGVRMVKDGGYLVTASCSFHMLPDLFQATVLDAATDAHKILRLVHFSGAAKDHPEIAGVEEGHYLKYAIYEVQSRK